MKLISFRLKPGDDLKEGIERIVAEHAIQAGCIVTCVGGLQRVRLRMAGATPEVQDMRVREEHFEIVSLVGTVSVNGVHLHMAVSGVDGMVFGGHLKEGSIVYPTAELVIGSDESAVFRRELDEQTGFKELQVS